jgi:hypothetical protein
VLLDFNAVHHGLVYNPGEANGNLAVDDWDVGEG